MTSMYRHEVSQVLLAIRGLGKSKSVLQQMPRHSRRPEKAVLHLMESAPAIPGGRLGLWVKIPLVSEMDHILRLLRS